MPKLIFTSFRLRHALRLGTAAIAVTVPLAIATPAWAQQVRQYNIAAQDLNSALRAFASATGRDVLYPPDLVADRRSPGVQGQMTEQDALRALLAGTGLRFELTRSNGYVVVRSAGEAAAGSVAAETESADQQEIVVTGTNIRGVTPSSPLTVITRRDIERSGYTSVTEVVNSQTQAFSGGQNAAVVGSPGAADVGNTGAISSPNLRGLGSAATLTLVNGRRLAPSGGGSAVDLSILPVSFIDRVEIVSDGASAIYGADAVGGVVNVVLRDHFEGFETTAVLGVPTRGGPIERRLDQTAGFSWSGGNLVIGGSYGRTPPLFATERSFSRPALPETTLLPGNETYSGFGLLRQSITPNLRAFVQGVYTDRDTESSFSFGNVFAAALGAHLKQHTVSGGLEWSAPAGWFATLAVSHAGERLDTSGLSVGAYHNNFTGIDVNASGSLFSLPSGDVKLAIGGGYQASEYSDSFSTSSPSRRETFAFGELNIPLVREDGARSGLTRLNLTAAGRWEHYSDFGSTFNPKLGLVYGVVRGLEFRVSWGTSFRAPSLLQVNSPTSAYLLSIPDPQSASDVNALLVLDGNPNLRPEKSRNFTIGAVATPAAVPGLRIEANYFNTRYRDQIASPITLTATALTRPEFAPFVTRNPSVALQQDFLQQVTDSGGSFFVFTNDPYDPANVPVLIDNRTQNVSASYARGIDLRASYDFNVGNADLQLFGAATWERLYQRLVAGADRQRVSGTVFHVPTLKARGGFNWTAGNFSGQYAVNYISGLLDNLSLPPVRVSSLFTSDLQLAYTFRLSSDRRRLRAAVSVLNLFDRDPPETGPGASTVTAVRYDSTNASPLGRIIRAQLTFDW